MWSNISAPKSGLKAAQVGHQLKPKQVLDQQRENGTANHNDSAQQAQSDYEQCTIASSDWTSSPESSKRRGSYSLKDGLVSASSPLMRYKHAVCASTSSSCAYIYIHGGRFGNGVPLDDDVWRFDPHENAWLQLRTSGCKPPSLQEHSLVEHQNNLYLFGGQVSAASGQENSFWRLDLAGRQWRSLDLKSSMKFGAYLGPSNRRGHSACVFRDSMYIFGGYEDFRGSTSQLWQYDLLNERWELRNLSASSACHPEARHSHSAVVHQDSMYIYGGLSNLKPLGDLWRWSWRDKRWFKERTRGKSPGPLHGHSAVAAFGSMFVFGGERASGQTTRSLWRLNLSNLCWQKIKTKGPRPNPTTWHVAIANPMGVLDEANYLIEGDASDLEADQQQQHDQLTLLVNQNHNNLNTSNQQRQSTSDNNNDSFAAAQQTIPMQSFRPVESNQQQQQQVMRAKSHRSQLGNLGGPRAPAISHSKSSALIEPSNPSKLASQSRDRVKTKRRLRLNFLRGKRGKILATGSKCANQSSTAPGQLPTSRSEASVLRASLPSNGQSPEPGNEDVNMTELTAEGSTEATGDRAPACAINHKSVGILESLDSDIKEMFQRAISPDDSELQSGDGKRVKQLARDSVTRSQLSSWLAPASTQSYQTAREQLTSSDFQSTSTITPTYCEQHPLDVDTKQQVPLMSSRLADVRQRRSMQHFSQVRRSAQVDAPGGATQVLHTRNGRPKSEIVQSLIDRADARIKHLYTPYFNLDQPHNSNHGGNSKGSQRHSSQYERQRHHGAAPKRPALDKSNRHTIHQTMTYYNLYFGQEPRALDSPLDRQVAERLGRASGGQLRRQPISSDLTQSSSTSSATTCKGSAGLSTSAALVGVRDGGATADSSTGSAPDEASQRTGSLMASSESRTLCDMNNNGSDDEPLSKSKAEILPEAFRQHRHYNPNGAQTNNECNSTDNTSLSFSMIAEFEEDDMLQYSSPTDPVITAAAETAAKTNGIKCENSELEDEQGEVEEEEEEEDDDYYDDDDEFMERPRGGARDMSVRMNSSEYNFESEQQEDRERCRNGSALMEGCCDEDENNNNHNNNNGNKQLVAQKSSSSGYDSLRSSRNNGSFVRERDELPGAAASQSRHQGELNRTCDFSTSSSLQTTTGNSSPNHTSYNTTTNTNEAESPPLTPPSKSLPSSPLERGSCGEGRQRCHKSSSFFASSLMSGPSRLFGKKKTKTRYWQLCMFVLGGKQQGGQHGNLNEPISIWRLYI